MTSTSSNTSSPAWWRVPHMWLVVGGPLVVVAACVVTVTIAFSIPDQVLDKATYQRDLAFANQLEGQARIDALAKLQPAHQARNHAASPVVPNKPQ
jgi:uncharacterized protein